MILVGSTMARFACERDDTSLSWLNNAEALRDSHPEGVEFFVAIELDGAGEEPFAKVIERVESLGGTVYRYRYDDGRTSITTGNRLWHICCGRNIVQDRAMDIGASHILFLDADTQAPPDAIPKLLELEHPIVGGHVGAYCLSGPPVHTYPAEWNVQQHWNTAGFLMVSRGVFKRIRWRYSGDDGLSDDPSYAQDAMEFLGYPTYVRHDVEARHFPMGIVAIERRFPGRDMSVI